MYNKKGEHKNIPKFFEVLMSGYDCLVMGDGLRQFLLIALTFPAVTIAR